jgi:rhodanese-related sulfurtransferase
MTYEQVLDALGRGAVLVEGRTPEEFALGHLRHAINIGLEGRYAPFAGSILPADVDAVLLTDAGHELEGKNRLARIGFDRVIGYLHRPEKVMFEHQGDVRVASLLTANAFGERAAEMADLQLVDVRDPGEAAAGMIPGAINIPVGQLPDRVDELDPTRPTVVYCAGGYRSSVAASLLRQRGFADVSDILGGYTAWETSRPERLRLSRVTNSCTRRHPRELLLVRRARR